jgi:endonuclease-3
MTRKERYEHFIAYFSTHQPEAETELYYENPYQLLVAVILSAQCTDKRVNLTTPAIFKQFPTPKLMAEADFDDVFSLIRSISYPNNKAKHLIGMANMLVNDFGSEVPSTIEDLVKLPGVGRKTANVIASVIFNQPAMAVDTHVFRVAARIGLTLGAKNPKQAEDQLIKYIPEQYVARAHHWLILHGRYVCVARNPKCLECKISFFCKSYPKLKPQEAQIRNPSR